MSVNPNKSAQRRRFLLLRGESFIAWLGVAAAGILVATMAMSSWWGVRAQREAAEAARREQVRALSSFLAQTAESMLSTDELSALRRLVMEAKRNAQLAECRIMLPDGRVVADGEPSRITAMSLPRRWGGGPLDGAENKTREAGLASFNQSLLVPGRGAATLLVTADTRVGHLDAFDLRSGAGLIAAMGLVALLLVYRQMRVKVVTLGMIRDALLAMKDGERARDALTIGGDRGPEAAAWNELLSEADNLRRTGLAEQAKGAFDRRRESRGEMELACDSLSVGLVILDERGCVRHTNGAAASLLGRKREELAGIKLEALIDHPLLKETTAAMAVGGLVARRTFEMTRGGGGGGEQQQQGGNKSVLRISVRPLRREDSAAVLLTIEDVTQQRVADESRNSFVAQATHELRTPLTNMRLCLETAVDEGAKDPAILSHSLNVLNQETRRLERMVTEILSVSEIESGSLRLRRDDVRMDALYESLKQDLAAPAKDKDQTLKFELPPKLPVIQADRDKLMLAMHNVIGNAIKYTPEGGRVTVTVNVSPDGKTVRTDVSDTGIGIKPEEQELIFDKFYRSKDPRVGKITGSGLGLALAREVARLHGGELTVRSEIDKGSTFTLVVPAAMVTAAAGAPAAAAAAAA